MSQLAVVPNTCVVVPMRPYTAALGAAARRRARSRIVAADTPTTPSTASGVNGASAAVTSSRPARCSATPLRRRPDRRLTTTLARAARRWASVPGRIGNHWEATSAVLLRRGSTTTTSPPRSRMRSMRPGQSGAVASEPLDA